MEMLSLLGRLSPKGLDLSQASGIFINFFFQVQVHDRVGSAVGFVEVYERTGKCVIFVGKKTQGLLDEFYGREKSRKRSGFVIHSYFKDRAFKQLQQLKGCQVPK